MIESRLEILFQKQLVQSLSPIEREELILLMDDKTNAEETKKLLTARWEDFAFASTSSPLTSEELEQILQSILPASQSRIHFLKVGWLRYAAAIILILSAGAYLWITNQKNRIPVITVNKPVQKDILPGREGAILTLANGTRVVLDSVSNGIVAEQGGSELILKDSMLVYNAKAPVPGEVAYNTMATPNGRQFQLGLPDGTKVWLNAASSITYPTVFTGKKRRVYVEGEVYFEVAKNTKIPFEVKLSDATEIDVLGTSFNISAYKNGNPVTATLLEGSIKVRNELSARILNPGEQVVVEKKKLVIINNADIEKAVAWKNGIFNFENTTIEEAMRQLARWYDLQIEYQQEKAPDIEFGGKMGMDLKLSQVLKGLEGSGLKFKIEGGNRLIITQ